MPTTINSSDGVNGQPKLQGMGPDAPSTMKGMLSYFGGTWSGWQLFLTVLVILVAYDQGTSPEYRLLA